MLFLSFLSFFNMFLFVEPEVIMTLIFKIEVAFHNIYPNWLWNSLEFQPLMVGMVLGIQQIKAKVMSRGGFIMKLKLQGPSLPQTPAKDLVKP